MDDVSEQLITFDYEIGDILDNIEIIDRKVEFTQGKRKLKFKKFYQYKCHQCGFNGSNICYKNGEELCGYWVTESILKRGVRCSCCRSMVVQPGINDVATTHANLVEYFVDKTMANKYSKGSHKSVQLVCPICKSLYPNEILISNFVQRGKTCIKCGNSLSYPEKFIYCLLNQLKILFEHNKIFEWSKNILNNNGTVGNKAYDFYLPEYNLIIETHGKQHYVENSSFSVHGEKGRTLEEEQNNDMIKLNLAKENLYNYVIIDCRESTLSFVKNSILNSELSKFICLDNIDWEECHNNALSWVQKSVIEEKINNPSVKGVEIAKKYNLSVCTIYEWWRKFINERQKIFFAVYSPELNQTYTDFDKASKIAGVSAKAIRKCAHHPDKLKHAGKHPITGERLTWIGYTKNEYEKINLSIKGA